MKTGLEFKGLRRAGAALIFGRGVKTLTFTLHSRASPLRLLKDREEARVKRKKCRLCAAYTVYLWICLYMCVGTHVCMTTCYIYGDKRWKDRNQTIYSVYGLISTLTSSISGITWIHLSFHKSVACMGNCKLSGLLRSIVPEGIRESLNGCRILSDCSQQVPQQHQHFLKQWYQHELLWMILI